MENATVQLPRKKSSSLHRAQRSERQLEATLIFWISKDDEAAFRQFYDATNGLLFGLLLRILGHTQTAEAVLSELYEEVRQKAARFSAQNETPLTWLVFMAHRRAIEYLCRSLNTQSESSHGIGKARSSKAPNPSINITQQRRVIRAAMDSIPHLQKHMIELAFFSGMTNLEIAEELHLSLEAVENGLRDAMLQLIIPFKSMGLPSEAGGS